MAKQYNPKHFADFKLEFIESTFISGISDKDYRAAEGLNQSFLKDIDDVSPSEAEYKVEHREEATPAMKIGSVMHSLALTPDDMDHYVIQPDCDRRTKEGKLIYEEFLLRSEGKVALKREDWELAERMAKASKPYIPYSQGKRVAHPEAVLYAKAVVAAGPFKGAVVKFKGKLDMLVLDDVKSPDGVVHIYDLKSCADISDIAGASYKSGWAVQSALYGDMASFAYQRPADFQYICIGKEQPHSVRNAIVTDEMMLKGRQRYHRATSKWLWYVDNGRPKTDEFYGLEELNG
jgi:exodeoxyribonuclease VIII